MSKLKRILITGARSAVALDLARHFHAVGCDVYMMDTWPTTLSHYSNAVKLYLSAPSPRFETQAFIQKLSNTIKKHKIDILIPTFEETLYIAQYRHQLPTDQCTVFCASFDALHKLHHKYDFQQRLKEHGIASIPTQLLTSISQLEQVSMPKPYIVKACYSRAALGFYTIKENSTLPVITASENNPWVAQQLLVGKKYCTYSVCQQGRVHAHVTYPVKIAIDGSSCILFEAIHHAAITQWIDNFVSKENYTGQIAFDFIETAEGLYAIECNPRSTSGVHLFPHTTKLAQAFLNEDNERLNPPLGVRRQIIAGMLMYGWRTSSSPNFSYFVKHFFSSSDVVFDHRDLFPFIMQPKMIMRILSEARRLKLSLPALFNHDLEWNNEIKNDTIALSTEDIRD